MDISLLTATNVHVNTYIPDDIVFSILSKLSCKSLKRFACVRKLWSNLFDNPTFMTMYYKSFLTNDHSYYNDTSLLLHMIVEDEDTKYQYHHHLYCLSGERFENKFKLDGPKSWDDPLDELHFDILGTVSINGTICLHVGCNGVKKIILWNPTTNEFKVIPFGFFEPGRFLRCYSSDHLVGYDGVKDDYNVIQFTSCTPCNPKDFIAPFWEIYSLKSNSWRKIDIHMPQKSYRDTEQVYMDGVTHDWWGKHGRRSYLGSFDFSDKSFVKTPLPSYVDDCIGIAWKQLVILNESIAFIVAYRKTSTFDILILGEVGVKKSWTKFFTVGVLPCLQYPIFAGNKGKIFFRRKDGELVMFDLNTGMIDEMGFKTEIFGFNILFHKESILPIGGIYN